MQHNKKTDEKPISRNFLPKRKLTKKINLQTDGVRRKSNTSSWDGGYTFHASVAWVTSALFPKRDYTLGNVVFSLFVIFRRPFFSPHGTEAATHKSRQRNSTESGIPRIPVSAQTSSPAAVVGGLFWPLHQCHESSWRPLCSAAQFLRMIDEKSRALFCYITTWRYKYMYKFKELRRSNCWIKTGHRSRTRTLKPPFALQKLSHIWTI